MTKGKITKQIGAYPDFSEQMVADLLALERGKDIEFIKPDTRYKVHTPDINMGGERWEIKCPESNKMDKVRRNIDTAANQSANIILGTFDTNIPDEKIIRFTTKYVKNRKKIKKVIIVTKHKKVIDIK
jgi:hypothetical protein